MKKSLTRYILYTNRKAVRKLSAEQFPTKTGINFRKEYTINKKMIMILTIDLSSNLCKVKFSEE